MHEKQQLNGAYYGPSIPPPPRTYHRPSRGGGFGCCCGCLFNLFFKLILTIIIIIGIAIFLFWLIVRPNAVKVHVTNASLTQFNFTNNNNNNLNYNLNLNITIRNPNKKLGLYYDYIEARALYHDVRVDSVFLDPFYMGHKTTHFLNPLFKGSKVIVLSSSDNLEVNKEKSLGVFEIDLKMYLKVRFKLGVFKSRKIKPKVTCKLKVPLNSAGGGSPAVDGGFQVTKCDWDR